MAEDAAVAARRTDVAASGGSSHRRRDHLAEIERNVQALWERHQVYDVDAPVPSDLTVPVGEFENKQEKFFCTFPYPYMNGRLHLGHAFTVTKAEFQARFQRLLGKRVLWPFAFHCTGMPILACADKLRFELSDTQAEQVSVEEDDADVSTPKTTVVGKFSGKKSKAVSKTAVSKTQREIMASCGVPEDLIPCFQDPLFWLSYFPPLAKENLQRFGLSVDWRRSFITTQANPYYDAFIRWQFNTLKKRNRIRFGMRPAVFSRQDGQACADHDRASGEGAGPQEYTLIKLQIQKLPEVWVSDPIIADRPVFLVAATLRPETMYAQTNCFVLPTGEYGLYLAFDEASRPREPDAKDVLRLALSKNEALERCHSIFVCSQRSAENMSHQGLIPIDNVDGLSPMCVKQGVKGTDLIGLPLTAPCAVYPTVYALPMMGISIEKGTGIVTSVPSDSPDDYAALRDLQEKPALREKFGVDERMVSFDIVEVIDIPGYGRRTAVDLCKLKKVKSQNDKEQLAEIKEEVYKKGFYEGVMVAGPYKGSKVCEVKDIIRKDLIDRGDAVTYYEPEKKVVSRSGDTCVVALCNQWYLDYGDASWKKEVEQFVLNPSLFTAYSPRCLNQFHHVIQWLREWACSRQYGLGTYLPWEIEKGNKVLIESLSDSTIYMAYYTIAHLLQGDINGSKPGRFSLKPEQLTDEVLDFIFMQIDTFPDCSISKETLNRMRNEFSYWYPLDLRVSGKDLIFNHLSMSLFNHAAIWPDTSGTKWPRSFFCNGHVLVDAEKMSKSAGNFLTVEGAIETYTADGTRIALADAGDSLDDANFQKESANAALMRLYLLDQFVQEVLDKVKSRSFRTDSKNWIDNVFENEIVNLAEQARQSYEKLQYREALKSGFFDFGSLRDQYRNFCGSDGMHEQSIMRWIEVQTVILAPIAPHICEFIWSVRLEKSDILTASGTSRWDAVLKLMPAFDALLHRKFLTLTGSLEEFRRVKEKSCAAEASAKKKNTEASTRPPLNAAVIYVAKEYLPWQQIVLKLLQTVPLTPDGRQPLDNHYVHLVRNDPEIKCMDKKTAKHVMPFACYRMKDELAARGAEALELQLPFNERALLEENRRILERLLGVVSLDIRWSTDAPHPQDRTDRINLALPSKPSIVFFNMKNNNLDHET